MVDHRENLASDVTYSAQISVFCISQTLTAAPITQPWLSPLNIQVTPFNRKKMGYDHVG
jgi:hypothetical protein